LWDPQEFLINNHGLLAYGDKGKGGDKVLEFNGNSVWFPGVEKYPGACPVPTVDALHNNMVLYYFRSHGVNPT